MNRLLFGVAKDDVELEEEEAENAPDSERELDDQDDDDAPTPTVVASATAGGLLAATSSVFNLPGDTLEQSPTRSTPANIRHARAVLMAAAVEAGVASGLGDLLQITPGAVRMAASKLAPGKKAKADVRAVLERALAFTNGVEPPSAPSAPKSRSRAVAKATKTKPTRTAKPAPGVKLDAGKPRPSLLPFRALCKVTSVLEHGAAKYGEGNWKHVENADARYVDASLRHLFAHAGGEPLDAESGLPHLAHAVASLLFLLENES